MPLTDDGLLAPERCFFGVDRVIWLIWLNHQDTNRSSIASAACYREKGTWAGEGGIGKKEKTEGKIKQK